MAFAGLVLAVLGGCSIASSDEATGSVEGAVSGKSCGNGSCSGHETCSSCPIDCGACPESTPPPPPPPPPTDAGTGTVDGYGPQASIACPAGAINIAPGQDIAGVVGSQPAGTTFCILAGTHYPTSAINPRAGDTLIGQYGAVLDGSRLVPMSYDVSSTSIIRGWNCTDCANVTVRNLVVRNLPEYNCVGLDSNGGTGWTVDHNEISGCKQGMRGATGARITSNSIHHNSLNGYSAYLVNDVLFEHNDISYNGHESKICLGVGVTFRDNHVHHQDNGIWFDGENTGSIIEGNTVEDNSGEGIFYEVSGQGVVRNNVVRRNGSTGVFVSNSHNVEVLGNQVDDNFRGITVFVDCSREHLPYPTCNYIGEDCYTANVSAHDNVIHIGTQAGVLANGFSYGSCDATQAATFTSGQKNITFSANRYFASDTTTRFWVWGDVLNSWSVWQAGGRDLTGSFQLQ